MIAEIILGILFFVFLILTGAFGAYVFFFTDQAIDFVFKLFNAINFVGIEPYLDPHGSTMHLLYKVVGMFMMVMAVCTMVFIIVDTLVIVFGGGKMCFGDVDNCVQF